MAEQPKPPPRPFQLQETSETWTGTIICLAFAYLVIPLAVIVGVIVWALNG